VRTLVTDLFPGIFVAIVTAESAAIEIPKRSIEHSFSTEEKPIASGRPDTEDLRKAMIFGKKIQEKIGEISRPRDISSIDRVKDSEIYRMSLFDNTYFPRDYIESIVDSHKSPSLYSRFILGQFAAAEGVTFNFDIAAHVDWFQMPHRGDCKVIYGLDVGWTNPTALLAVLIDKDGRAFCVDEFYQSQVTNERLLSEVEFMLNEWGDGTIYVDPSSPETIDLLHRNRYRAEASKGKRDDGIRQLGERFFEAGDGRRRLYVDPRCVNLIGELQVYDETKKKRV